MLLFWRRIKKANFKMVSISRFLTLSLDYFVHGDPRFRYSSLVNHGQLRPLFACEDPILANAIQFNQYNRKLWAEAVHKNLHWTLKAGHTQGTVLASRRNYFSKSREAADRHLRFLLLASSCNIPRQVAWAIFGEPFSSLLTENSFTFPTCCLRLGYESNSPLSYFWNQTYCAFQ